MINPKPEEPNPIRLMLLSLVKLGLATPYDFFSKVGLSVGLTSPALQRMEEDALLESAPGLRNSKRYVLTKKGEKELRSGLDPRAMQTWRFDRFGNFEAMLRPILLAWISSNQAAVQYFIQRADEELRHQSKCKKNEAEQIRDSIERIKDRQTDLFGKPDDGSGNAVAFAAAYRWLKTESEAAVLALQADMVNQLGSKLANLPSIKGILGSQQAGEADSRSRDDSTSSAKVKLAAKPPSPKRQKK